MAEMIGKTIAEKFRIDELIKRSRVSELYRATHLLIDKPVTVKLLSETLKGDNAATEQFFKEARETARIGHSNVLNIIDFGTDTDGTPFAVCDGPVAETLRSVILRDGALPADVAVDITRQTALALGSGHEIGVVHGGLSTESILLVQDQDGRLNVKVTDFRTPNAMMNGDPLDAAPEDLLYLAPEICSGADLPDVRSDIYSLGAILYEMLAGTPPFVGEKPTDVMLKHIEEAPAPLVAFRSDLPPELEPVILKALAKDPAMRQQTMQELIDDLERKAEPQAAAAAAQSGGDFWKTAFMVLIGTGVLAAALIYATSVKQTDPAIVLMPDANGLPVQPINPATGFEEQQLAVMPGAMPDYPAGPGQTAADTLPGGDGYNPWATGVPPPGAPTYVPPGGPVVVIDPNNPSQFMPPDGGVILVPVPANVNTKPSPSPTRTPAANANTAPAPTPAATPPPPAPKPDPKPSPGDGEGADG